MSQSHYPNYADTVEIDFVKEICKAEYDEFIFALNKAEVCFDEFCCCKFTSDELNTKEEYIKKIDEAYEALQKKFKSETGLELYVVYADAEERGDELDGGSFAVGGVYCKTLAGDKYIKKIERKSWNTFG